MLVRPLHLICRLRPVDVGRQLIVEMQDEGRRGQIERRSQQQVAAADQANDGNSREKKALTPQKDADDLAERPLVGERRPRGERRGRLDCPVGMRCVGKHAIHPAESSQCWTTVAPELPGSTYEKPQLTGTKRRK